MRQRLHARTDQPRQSAILLTQQLAAASQKKTAMAAPTRWRRCTSPGGCNHVADTLFTHAGSISLLDLIERALAQRGVLYWRFHGDEHCSVARKMTGLWQRQQCGYDADFASAMSAPRDFNNSMIGWFAEIRFAVILRQSSCRRPASSTLVR